MGWDLQEILDLQKSLTWKPGVGRLPPGIHLELSFAPHSNIRPACIPRALYEERFSVGKPNSTPQPGLQMLNDSTKEATPPSPLLITPTVSTAHGAYRIVRGQHLAKPSEDSVLKDCIACIFNNSLIRKCCCLLSKHSCIMKCTIYSA